MRFSTLIIVMIVLAIFPQMHHGQVNPQRPSVSDNAFITQFRQLELEFGLSHDAALSSFPVLLKYGVSERFQAGLLINGLYQKAKNAKGRSGDPGFQFKYRAFTGDGYNGTFGLQLESLKGLGGKYTGYYVFFIPTKLVNIHSTIAEVYIPDLVTDDFYSAYAILLSPVLSGDFGFYAEIFGELRKSNSPVLGLDLGISYLLNPDLALDLAYYTSLNDFGPAESVQLGFTANIIKF